MYEMRSLVMRTGFWQALEALPGGEAVLAEWQWELDGEFDAGRRFLRPTQAQSDSHPCTNRFSCECRHRVMVHAPTRMVAVCECEAGDCPPITLEPKDVMVWALDVPKVAESVRRVLGFESTAANVSHAASRSRQIGTTGALRSPVYFHCPSSVEGLLRELEGLFGAGDGHFILLTPTWTHYATEVESAIRRNRCALIPLSRVLSLDETGFVVTSPVEPMLKEFERRLVEGGGLSKTVEKIGRDIEAVAKGQYELRRENEDLKRLHAEGYFQFALRVDGEDFRAFAVIMALGNRKAAADFLETPQRTFYDRVDRWSRMSRDHQRMHRMVEWRKRNMRQTKVRLEDSVAYGDAGEQGENPATLQATLDELKDRTADSRDYPEILKEILEAMQGQNASNWGSVREEVLEIITEELPQ